MSDPLVYVRFRRGVVGETRRTVHLVPLPPILGDPAASGEHTHVLTALCGEQFSPGEAELLPAMAGMPCVACLSHTPGPPEIDTDSRRDASRQLPRAHLGGFQLPPVPVAPAAACTGG